MKIRGSFTLVLNPIAERTEVTYTMAVNMCGRLAQFGQAVIESSAKKLVAIFSGCVQKELGA